MTKEEFFDWAPHQAVPHELVDGLPVPLYYERDEDGRLRAMTAGSDNHHALILTAALAIERRKPPSCRVLVGGPALSTKAETVREPDVLLACGPRADQAREAQTPCLIVEVLSPSTANVDRGEKLFEYQELTSVQEIWLVDSQRRAVTSYVRGEGVWISRTVIGEGEFPSEVLEGRITLDELYEGIHVRGGQEG